MSFPLRSRFSRILTPINTTDHSSPTENAVTDHFQFNGYTNYWHDIYRDWIRYGNLFKIAVPKVDYTIAQSKIDVR